MLALLAQHQQVARKRRLVGRRLVTAKPGFQEYAPPERFSLDNKLRTVGTATRPSAAAPEKRG